jgi:hypothetical protein
VARSGIQPKRLPWTRCRRRRSAKPGQAVRIRSQHRWRRTNTSAIARTYPSYNPADLDAAANLIERHAGTG